MPECYHSDRKNTVQQVLIVLLLRSIRINIIYPLWRWGTLPMFVPENLRRRASVVAGKSVYARGRLGVNIASSINL